MRPSAVALTLLLLALPRASAHGAEAFFGLRLETGVEHDSNPERLEEPRGLDPPAISAAQAARLTAGLDAQLLTEDRHLFALHLSAAAKRFFQEPASGEDLLLLDGRASLDLALGARNTLGLSVGHYDVLQRAAGLPDARDFRSTAPGLRWDHQWGGARFGLGGGWRWFAFKPERAFDFQAPTAFLSYRHHLAPPLDHPDAEWDWSASLQFEHRDFSGPRCASLASCLAEGAPSRSDQFFALALDLTRTGAHLFGAGTSLVSNRSNSYGESLERLAFHLRAALLLPLGLSLAARAEGVLTRYRDRVPVGHDAVSNRFVNIEDEGRSTLRLELARPIGDRCDLGLRYTLFTSAPRSSEVKYERQIALFFVALQLGQK
jgi:hypothetical protein